VLLRIAHRIGVQIPCLFPCYQGNFARAESFQDWVLRHQPSHISLTLSYFSYVAELLIPFAATVHGEQLSELSKRPNHPLNCQGSPAKRSVWSSHFILK
jgi:hypothetical protein